MDVKSLFKFEGKHKGKVKVMRDGKTFYREQMLGRKEDPKLSKMSNKELKDEINNILNNNSNIKKSVEDWYTDQGRRSFEEEITETFKMDRKTSGSPNKNISVDDKIKSDYKKIYSITQEYLKRNKPHGIIIYRGLGEKSHEKFKDGYPGKDINVDQRNVSSWTTNYNMAQEFAELKDTGVIIETLIENKRIFIHPDCAPKYSDYEDEDEVIIMGTKIDGVISELFN